MNHHLTIALIIFTIFIDNANCNDGMEMPKLLNWKNEPTFMNLVVKAFLDSPNCHGERIKKGNYFYFHDESGKYLITEDGLKLLREVKYPCKIQLPMSQLDKHGPLKRDLQSLLSNGEILSDGYMSDGSHKREKAIRGDLVASILQGMEENVAITDEPLIKKIAHWQKRVFKQSKPTKAPVQHTEKKESDKFEHSTSNTQENKNNGPLKQNEADGNASPSTAEGTLGDGMSPPAAGGKA